MIRLNGLTGQRIMAMILGGFLLASCTETQFVAHTVKRIDKAGERPADRGAYKVGKPYRINGVWYYPAVDYGYAETGIASWYGPKFHLKRTANGEVFDMNKLSAAHRTLPMPSYVRVTNLENGRSLNLRVNDRGPFAHSRIIDVSRRAAQLLGFMRNGTARVRVEILPDESQQVATRMGGQAALRKGETPITVAKLPKQPVSAESLAPPPGASVAAEPTVTYPTVPRPAVVQTAEVAPVSENVVTVPVSPTRLFVQAGAFTRYDNANRARSSLTRLGAVEISHVLVEGQDFYRVRVGPADTVQDADFTLERVIRSGFPTARIVVVD